MLHGGLLKNNGEHLARRETCSPLGGWRMGQRGLKKPSSSQKMISASKGAQMYHTVCTPLQATGVLLSLPEGDPHKRPDHQ
ncbi:hypothetical protein [Xenorhabdus bovienii]|uniref:hypothetical protein n=1 Tax=Xenorhabdus bovienii TaxID=40576 RepID=UPI0012D2C640|nr:hypothetical protein [Xenorhabdus bovienii]